MKKTKKSKINVTIETKRVKLNLQYKFTEPELKSLGKELAESQIQLRQLDDDRKRVTDEWKAKISSKESDITSLSNKVSSGYEYRDIECEVTLNEPEGKKTARRMDTNEIVWVRDLDDEEKQRTLDFDEDEEHGL